MKLPSNPLRGEDVIWKITEIINFLRASRITSVTGGQLRETPNGTVLTIKPGKGGGSSSEPIPLTIKQGTAADKFQVIPGYVNSEMPTLSAIALNATTPPEITVTADVWVWLKCVGTFGAPDTYVVTVETSSTDAVPAGTDITSSGFTSFFPIGSVDFESGTPDTFTITNVHSGGNLGVDSWGLINLWWRA